MRLYLFIFLSKYHLPIIYSMNNTQFIELHFKDSNGSSRTKLKELPCVKKANGISRAKKNRPIKAKINIRLPYYRE